MGKVSHASANNSAKSRRKLRQKSLNPLENTRFLYLPLGIELALDKSGERKPEQRLMRLCSRDIADELFERGDCLWKPEGAAEIKLAGETGAACERVHTSSQRSSRKPRGLEGSERDLARRVNWYVSYAGFLNAASACAAD